MNKKDIDGVIEKERDKILKKKNVSGVGRGLKIRGGKLTDEEGIVVFVSKKDRNIEDEEKIPEKIENIKTDVVEVEIVPQSMYRYVRPFMSGDEIGPLGVYVAGTVGLIFRWRGDDYGLTNWHVVEKGEEDVMGVEVIQPAAVGSNYKVGEVVKYVSPMGQTADAAVFKITIDPTNPQSPDMGWNAPGSHWDNQLDSYINSWPNWGLAVPLAGFPHHHNEYDGNIRDNKVEMFGNRPFANGFGVVETGEKIWKSGRTTGITHGIIHAKNLWVWVNYGPTYGPVFMKRQYSIYPDPEYGDEMISMGGDSGSCWVDGSNHVIALHFAGSNNPASPFGVATPIQTVFSQLFTYDELFGYNLNHENGWTLDENEYYDNYNI